MKTTSLLLFAALAFTQGFAQETDTLKKFGGTVAREAGKYSGRAEVSISNLPRTWLYTLLSKWNPQPD